MRLLVLAVFTCAIFFSCNTNNVIEDASLQRHFTKAGVQGTFALMDNSSGAFTIHNLERYRDSAYLPASTFDIVASLIGLQTGKIVSDTAATEWSGIAISKANAGCDGAINMITAFRTPCIGWYNKLATTIGKDTMQRWLDSLAYGNKKISRVDTFWLDNSLKIRPDEQMGLIKKLYFKQLPFFAINQQKVIDAMLFEDKPQYKLSYKTGLGYNEKGDNLGWIVGWIEENKHPYFFVLNFTAPRTLQNLPEARMQLLKDCLAQLGFFKGLR